MANILIVDDNMIMRKFLKALLTQAEHTIVGEAENGAKAVDMYKTLKPDVVLLDISMPVMDGIEALRKIIDYDSAAKVIMASALDEKSKIFETIEIGAKHYIVKPFEKKNVIEIINKVLQ